MRMTRADANPNDFDGSFRRKGSDFFDRQKKRAKLDRLQFFAQGKIDILRHVREKPEGEMDLIARGPVHAANVRIELNQNLANGLRRIDRDEKTLHCPARIASPLRDSLPS